MQLPSDVKTLSLVTAALLLASISLNASASCNESSGPITGENSKNFDAFTQLYNSQSTKLDDYLKLWYPKKSDGLKLDSPLFDCEDGPSGSFKQPLDNGPLPENCRPDTLYSWGSEKMSHVVYHFQDGQAWTGPINNGAANALPGGIFTSISSVSTFGYGERVMRFKIKRGTPYKIEGFGAQDGEVGVRSDGMFHDFAMKDASIIESMSMGTPEIYDEVVRDIMHFKANKRVSTYTPDTEDTGLTRLYDQSTDGHDQTETKLIANLREILREILQGEGVIHYSAGVCRSRALTFSTTSPSYIDPIPSRN